MSRGKRSIRELVLILKVLAAVSVIALVLIFAGATMAYNEPTHTFSEDHFTVANTTDGEEVIVAYEVGFEKHGEMSGSEKETAMYEMDMAASCANEKLDEWLQSHSSTEARNSNLEEITISCHSEHITIDRVNIHD